jgi:hypothetical protein
MLAAERNADDVAGGLAWEPLGRTAPPEPLPPSGRPAAAAAAAATTAAEVAAAPAARSQLQPDEAELVRAFAAHELVHEALHRRSQELKGTHGGAQGGRVPSTLRAIERRWFVGRQTVKKAAQKTAGLAGTINAAGVLSSYELVGTATLLGLSQNGSGLVKLCPGEVFAPPPAEGMSAGPYRELQLSVKVVQRGGSTVKGARRMLTHKRFFLHQDVVTVCLQHADEWQQRQQAGTARAPNLAPATHVPLCSRAAPKLAQPEPGDSVEATYPTVDDSWISAVGTYSNDPSPNDGVESDLDLDFGASIGTSGSGSGSDQDALSSSSSPAFWEQDMDDSWSASSDGLTAASISSSGSEDDLFPSSSDSAIFDNFSGGSSAVDNPFAQREDEQEVLQRPHLKRPHEPDVSFALREAATEPPPFALHEDEVPGGSPHQKQSLQRRKTEASSSPAAAIAMATGVLTVLVTLSLTTLVDHYPSGSGPAVSGEISPVGPPLDRCEKRPFPSLSFSYVCPEPVLAKRSFIYINCSKRPRSSLAGDDTGAGGSRGLTAQLESSMEESTRAFFRITTEPQKLTATRTAA